ncbi:MAG: metallophosphoesterase [Terracidiphilus sp.]|nr:metallophosphoesterase [Terracidiphilus sp.]
MKAWPVLGIAFIQCTFLLENWFLYKAWVAFCGHPPPHEDLALRAALLLLACSFVVAALLSFYSASLLVKVIYRVAAVWLGFLTFLFCAACLSWLVWGALLLSRLDPAAAQHRPLIAWFFLDVALAVGFYGLLNARRVRIRRVSIRLANLPLSWRGRRALLVSDLHLGHVNALRFSRRIATLAAGLEPDAIFIPGDFFDGAKADPDRLAAPFKRLSPPFGMYFSTGNHDEFGDTARFLAALTRAGVRVLANEKVVVDGLQILGVPYHDTTFPIRLRASLEAMKLDRGSASILLNHVPNRLPIVEEAGVSLQLSGHTHGGQIFPFTWLTRRVFGKFTHGLNMFGALQVYTSYGAGTWGPPMRVGTTPEMVLLTFE